MSIGGSDLLGPAHLPKLSALSAQPRCRCFLGTKSRSVLFLSNAYSVWFSFICVCLFFVRVEGVTLAEITEVVDEANI